MAITKIDSMLKARVEHLINQFKDKSDKEVIYAIAGLCKISYRTASEHFHAFKAKQTLLDMGFKEDCPHDWTSPYGTAGGLVKECRLCHETEEIRIPKGNTINAEVNTK